MGISDEDTIVGAVEGVSVNGATVGILTVGTAAKNIYQKIMLQCHSKNTSSFCPSTIENMMRFFWEKSRLLMYLIQFVHKNIYAQNVPS